MKRLRITLEGKTYEVEVEVLDERVPAAPSKTQVTPASAPVQAPPVSASRAMPVVEGCRQVTSPMAGQIFKCLVKQGDVVAVNQVVVVLDAMKMETPVVSPFAGKVRDVLAREGDAVDEGHPLVQIEESA